MALTECHLNGRPELRAAWWQWVRSEVEAAQKAGAKMVAMGAWALFGSVDWNSLMT